MVLAVHWITAVPVVASIVMVCCSLPAATTIVPPLAGNPTGSP
jgi:hypothetical protein